MSLVFVQVDVNLWMALHEVCTVADSDVAVDKADRLLLDQFDGGKRLWLFAQVLADESWVCLVDFLS